MKKGTHFLAGASIGLLIGILIGLSQSNTVSIIIGSLTSSLLIFLGYLKNSNEKEQTYRLIGFGFLCVVGLFLGLFIRTHNSLSPSIKTDISKWTTDSLFTIEEAKSLIIFERLGIIPSNTEIDTNDRFDYRNSILFSFEISQDVCNKLKGYEKYTIDEELNAYLKKGGIWKSISIYVNNKIEEPKQKETLHLIRNCLCYESE